MMQGDSITRTDSQFGTAGAVWPAEEHQVGLALHAADDAPSAAAHALTSPGRERLTRAFDVLMTLVLAPFVLLLGSLIAVAIFIDSPGPVFYRASRVGRHGAQFSMLKFRKMKRASVGSPLTTSSDERFTPIGAFLALTKLDELPQFWNVLRGDMRLVGPRPEVTWFVDMYRSQYETILTQPPGITGTTQLEFFQESRLLGHVDDAYTVYCNEILPRKVEMDSEYIRSRSLSTDVAVLARTLLLPFRLAALKLAQEARSANHLVAIVAASCTVSLILAFVLAR